MTLGKRAFAVAAAVVVTVVIVQCAKGPMVEEAPRLLSAAVEVDGWAMDYEPEIYVGDSLFELINGGAEVYHRFGFIQALATQYSDGDGRSISLEVFEMGDVEGARNIYADKTGGAGEPLEIGDEAAGEDYYLNFRSGPFLVTITGFESDDADQRWNLEAGPGRGGRAWRRAMKNGMTRRRFIKGSAAAGAASDPRRGSSWWTRDTGDG